MNGNPTNEVHSLNGLRTLAFRPHQLGVVGWPVKHSVSPPMHEAALSVLGVSESGFLEWSYEAFELKPEALEEAIGLFREKGFRGVNLTVPHKVDVLPFIERIDPEAELMGAVNTVVFEEDHIAGHNTDGYGLANAVKEAFGIGFEGREVLVLGAGGASRATVAQCLKDGALRILIANRTVEKAVGIAERLCQGDERLRVEAVSLDQVRDVLSPGMIVINATSLGLKADDPLPVDVNDLPENCLLFDMIYNPSETQLLAAGRHRGYPVSNGLGMLVHQGVRSLEIWTGREVDSRAMRDACVKALALRY